MASRLVLECGADDRTALDVLAGWAGDLTVVASDRSREESLREAGAVAHTGDPTDSAEYPDAVDTVLVTGTDLEQVERAARSAREAFPAAFLAVQLPTDADADLRPSLSDVADEFVDVGTALAAAVVEVSTGEAASRLYKLRRVLRRFDGPLAVVTHDNPDPDAIGSALALTQIAAAVGVDADVCYFGDISHQENRALVNLLNLELRNVQSAAEFDEYAGIALVDHSRPGVNDGLPEDTVVDIVIDHHPPRAPVEAAFLDLRSDVGATSTLLADYLERFGLDPDQSVATALLYGIRVDTRNFTREISERDFEAAAYLMQFSDTTVLNQVEAPSMSPDVLDTIGRAIRNREVRDDVAVSAVGRIRDRDALAQAAEQLLDIEGVNISLVYGFMNGTVFVSGRARGSEVDLGETLRDALDSIGSAGGHADMAGAQVPLGILGDVEEESTESLAEVVDEMIKSRFFETLELPQNRPGRSADRMDFVFELPMDEQ